MTMIMLFKEDDDDGLPLGQRAEAHYQVVFMRVAMMVIIEVMMVIVMIVGTMVNKMVVIVLTTIP